MNGRKKKKYKNLRSTREAKATDAATESTQSVHDLRPLHVPQCEWEICKWRAANQPQSEIERHCNCGSAGIQGVGGSPTDR